ncbi:nuclear exosome regulator NRDE2 isoform X2 [Periplaneta americana]|uniref:nuclear exosome regulator NRDE2 isoform X2 n=1 Tax=Periplaneta americana TaxID=6978 RepID=UPI0037E86731
MYTMSLFPAYSNNTKPQKITNDDEENQPSERTGSWLTNASFAVEISQIPLPGETVGASVVAKTLSERCNEEDFPKAPSLKKRSESPVSHKSKKSSKHKKLKSHHKHKRKKYEEPEIVRNDRRDFFEDKTCERGYLSVSTLLKPAVPQYHALRQFTVGHIDFRRLSKKKKRLHRYYKHLHLTDTPEVISTKETSEDKNEHKAKELQIDDSSKFTTDWRLEEDLSKNTAQYNKSLTDQPTNIELWLKYVQFQDVISQFERHYRRGGGAKGARVLAERKLAILDKALQHNPESEILLKERIAVAEAMFPADTLSRQLGDMLEKQPANLALWHGYVAATQCSLAMCTVPAVTQLYNKAMTRLHQLRRGVPAAQTEPTELKILALLQDCGLFLRQAGLWEQLWLLLRLYLELNLSQPDSNHFKINSTLSEELVTETEERILSSQLPLSEIWLRVEQLREGVHWLPWVSDEDCEDPQRVVFSDDVSDLLHPITTASLLPNLTAIALMLLKVPLLPCRDTALRIVYKDQKSWYWDAVEMLLPALFPTGTLELECVGLFADVTQLVIGPQYLDNRLGQEQYLEFVVRVFQLCADCLPEPSRTAFCVWWLRFERLLLVLNRLGICKLPQNRKKKLKSTVKDFLKQDRNRNNLLFYREYALIECELGHHEGARKILTTAITAQPGSLPVVSVLNDQEKAGLGSLYRTLCELYLSNAKSSPENASTYKQKAVSVLIALALGKSLTSLESSSHESLDQLVTVSEKFHHIATELLQDRSADTAATFSEHLLPDFCVDWITCHAWFLFLTHSTWAGGAIFEDILAKIPLASSSPSSIVTVTSCRREALFESYVNMLHHHCSESPGTYSVLQGVLQGAMKEFPNNLYLLSTAAKLQAGVDGMGSPWWKVTRCFTDAGSLTARLFLVLIARQRQSQKEKQDLLTHNYLHTAGPIVPDKSARNRLEALFTVLKTEHLTKRCPLIWRFYLRFLYDHGIDGTCKTTFYRAVEECPWIKALYIDAAKLVPGELPQVQDLIIEKELRLHVTPEELDILRAEPS